MPSTSILVELVVIMMAALVVLAISQRLRVPPVIGFLLTGVLIGPHGLALVSNTKHVEVFAELGVVFLLFLIGLELSLPELRRVGRYLLLGGPIQVGVTIALVSLIARAVGASWPLAIFTGFLVALSSTAIVLRLYRDRQELDAPYGRLALGILLFQDVMIVPMLLVVPVLAQGDHFSPLEVAFQFGEGLLVMAAVFLVGRLLMPRAVALLMNTRIREVLVLFALVASLGTALLTQALGLTMALGAFLAGVALAESDFRYQIRSEIASFRDVFTSLFFISIGMLLSLGFVASNALLVGGAVGSVLVLKFVIVFLTARLLRLTERPAILAALGLCQIGEFSFVLVHSEQAKDLLGPELHALVIATSVVSMVATPVLIAWAPGLADRFARVSPASARGDNAPSGSQETALIAGFGTNGQHIARLLQEAGIAYQIVDCDGAVVSKARRAGHSILFGDVTQRRTLEAAGLQQCSLAVFALSDHQALRQTVKLARTLKPGLHIVARTRRLEEIDPLTQNGADHVVTQDLETSIELARHVLERFGLPHHQARAAADVLRSDHYHVLREPALPAALHESLLRTITAGGAESFPLSADHPAVGQTIRQLKLRQETGATILAVLRGENAITHPDPELRLEAGDDLILVGSPKALEASVRFLAFDSVSGSEAIGFEAREGES